MDFDLKAFALELSRANAMLYREAKGKRNVIETYSLEKFILDARSRGVPAEQMVEMIHQFCKKGPTLGTDNGLSILNDGSHTVPSVELMPWRDLTDEVWSE